MHCSATNITLEKEFIGIRYKGHPNILVLKGSYDFYANVGNIGLS
jgi:hypothetical protein